MGAKRPLKKTKNRRRLKKIKKKNFFLRGDFRQFSKKKCSYLRPLLSIFFPQGFRISKNIGHPTFRSRMSNIFKDSESLGKRNGKKLSQIWTFLFENCLKLPHKKKLFFFTFFGLLRFLVFFNGLFEPTSRSRMSNIFRDSESWGKSNGKKWSNIWTFLFGSGLKSPRKKKFFFLLLLILPWSTLLCHRCYYPHRSRDALSPVCGIFNLHLTK